jgi:DNA-binding transcriptional LysR family regulator
MPKTPVQNIPIEHIRTMIAVAETGSLSKAAQRLGLSQPAISAQMKRLQFMAGGELFVKTANGTTLTELGRLALQHGRRILDANDQILALSGIEARPSRRVGIPCVFAQPLFDALDEEARSGLFIHAIQSSLIKKGITDGYIDVACFFCEPGAEGEELILEEHLVEMTWVKSRDFVLSPGAPIPIIAVPEDDWMISPLSRRGISYRIGLKTADNSIRISGVRAAMGLTAMPASMVPPDLVKAQDYYLPKLPPRRVVICARSGLDQSDVRAIAQKLSNALFPGDRVKLEAPKANADRHARRGNDGAAFRA